MSSGTGVPGCAGISGGTGSTLPGAGGTEGISRGGAAAWNVIDLSCLIGADAKTNARRKAGIRLFGNRGLAVLVLRLLTLSRLARLIGLLVLLLLLLALDLFALLAIAILLLRRILLLVVHGVSPCSPRPPE